jgi:DNA-binding protein H-NS
MSQIRKLQAKADRLSSVRAKAISQVNQLISKFDIAASELTNGSAKRVNGRAKRKTKVAPKYRGPGGLTWAGRGLMPVWLRQAIAKGKKKEDFLIKKTA